MSKVHILKAREILDSRGNPTVEVSCVLEGGKESVASVPSGISTGIHEAHELRDHDERFGGLGVRGAVRNIQTEIQDHVLGKEFDQTSFDTALIAIDGTENKSRLGSNAILGCSLAFAKAAAQEKNLELFEYFGHLVGNSHFTLPQPMFNVINGGKHADSGLDIQEFLLAPTQFDSFHEKVRVGSEIIAQLKNLLRKKGYAVSVGDEGGFAPKLSTNEEAFLLIKQSVIDAGYSLDQVKIGIDVAASSLYQNGLYHLKIEGVQKSISSEDLISWYTNLVDLYPILFIEDGLAEDDWDGFSHLRETLGERITIVGDDLTVTNTKRIEQAKEKKAINSVLIKLNQVGTLTETIEAVTMTKKQGWTPFISHRSGETTDTTIADLAVGLSCDYIKSGSLVRGERVCKYNRLMYIEELLSGR